MNQQQSTDQAADPTAAASGAWNPKCRNAEPIPADRCCGNPDACTGPVPVNTMLTDEEAAAAIAALRAQAPLVNGPEAAATQEIDAATQAQAAQAVVDLAGDIEAACPPIVRLEDARALPDMIVSALDIVRYGFEPRVLNEIVSFKDADGQTMCVVHTLRGARKAPAHFFK